jgi:OmpA family protein
MKLRKSAVLISSALFLLATGTLAQANPRYSGSPHGYTSQTTVTETHEYYPETYDQPNGYYNYAPKRVYIEQHIYRHEAPRVVYQQPTYYQQPQQTHYQSAPQYSSYNRGGNIVGDTLIGGALGAAAGAAIGAVTGNPAAGAQIGAVVGGFGGISRGVLGRGLLW